MQRGQIRSFDQKIRFRLVGELHENLYKLEWHRDLLIIQVVLTIWSTRDRIKRRLTDWVALQRSDVSQLWRDLNSLSLETINHLWRRVRDREGDGPRCALEDPLIDEQIAQLHNAFLCQYPRHSLVGIRPPSGRFRADLEVCSPESEDNGMPWEWIDHLFTPISERKSRLL